MEVKRRFQGIFIPASLYELNDLNWVSKILLVEIDSLSSYEAGCFASNEHFARHLMLSKDRVSKLITNLVREGYATIKLEYKIGSKEVSRRYIYLTEKYSNLFIGTSVRTSAVPIGENTYTPIGENAEENISSFNDLLYKEHKVNSHHSYPSDVEKQKQTSSKSKCSEEEARFFEEIWLLYPRKNGKADVSDKHKKVLYKLGYDVVKKCIDRYLSENKNPEFYKYGSTFFKSGYIDYLDENYSQRSVNGETEQREVGQPLDLNNMKQKERFQQ